MKTESELMNVNESYSLRNLVSDDLVREVTKLNKQIVYVIIA